jgi:hypothetical protein
MESKIRKIKNQKIYEVKLYVRTLKDARATVAMHGMEGGAGPDLPMTPLQHFMADRNNGVEVGIAGLHYLGRIVPLYHGPNALQQALTRLGQDLGNIIPPAHLNALRADLAENYGGDIV